MKVSKGEYEGKVFDQSVYATIVSSLFKSYLRLEGKDLENLVVVKMDNRHLNTWSAIPAIIRSQEKKYNLRRMKIK